jgi:hypothetical protein
MIGWWKKILLAIFEGFSIATRLQEMTWISWSLKLANPFRSPCGAVPKYGSARL